MEKILKEIEAEAKIEEMRRINTGKEDKKEMIWITFEREEDKKMV